MNGLLAIATQNGPSIGVIVGGVRSDWVLATCGAALVVLAIAVLYLWNSLYKVRTGSRGTSSKDLFLELCNAHELNRLERTLIDQLAAIYELPQPGVLFIDPWTLEQAATASGAEAHRYAALRQKLFGMLD